MDAALWVQTSAEYEILAQTVYEQAAEALELALSDTSRSAALEQRPPFSGKPPAVIVDVDETVLDNSPFQAQLVHNGSLYTPELWGDWVARASADWVPGAQGFLEAARDRNVAVFYVTNRRANEEAATLRNLERLGAGPGISPDRVLTRGEREDWTSDKTSRRAFVARDYRVLLLVGDDLNDFLPARTGLEERARVADEYGSRFGRDWFLLPNPSYGSWERALSDEPVDCERVAEKRSRLSGFVE